MSAQLSLAEMNPLLLVAVFVGMAMMPILLLGVTSFLKITVVLSILRSALGAGQIPSAAITTLLALVLSGYIMAPVAIEMRSRIALNPQQSLQELRIEQFLELAVKSFQPLQEFLATHSGAAERQFFRELYQQRIGDGQKEHSFAWLIPAFVLTELREAFVIGFTIYLPFLVVDLVVANLLVGLGMVMVSPATISLPLKIFLFIASDAWLLLTRSLVMGYWPAGVPG